MTKPWVKVLEKVQLFEKAHSPNESNTESSGFKINFTECKSTVQEAHERFVTALREMGAADTEVATSGLDIKVAAEALERAQTAVEESQARHAFSTSLSTAKKAALESALSDLNKAVLE